LFTNHLTGRLCYLLFTIFSTFLWFGNPWP
jgi:hypothetical protein